LQLDGCCSRDLARASAVRGRPSSRARWFSVRWCSLVSRGSGRNGFPEDEPHYPIIAQSLWKDGDLRFRQSRGDYFGYDKGLLPDF
jgi:hypothetical protein